MKIDLEQIGDRICEQLCKDNDGCKFDGNCIECLFQVGKLLMKSNEEHL